MTDSRKVIKDLKLKANTALFWGDDAEDVKILENVDKETFDKVSEAFEDRPAFYAGENDDDFRFWLGRGLGLNEFLTRASAGLLKVLGKRRDRETDRRDPDQVGRRMGGRR